MYRILGLHFSRWITILWPLTRFLTVHIPENDISNLLKILLTRDVILVFPRLSLFDILILNWTLSRHGISLALEEAHPKRTKTLSILALKPRRGFTVEREDVFIPRMSRILRNDPRWVQDKLCLVPVSVFWGRGAKKGDRHFLLKALFPDDGDDYFFNKLILFFLNRKYLSIHLSPPIVDLNGTAVSLLKDLRTAFIKERNITVGPSLYDFSSLSQSILESPEIKKLTGDSVKSEKLALDYLQEIVASYNNFTIRAFETILEWLWSKIFKDLRIHNFESVSDVIKSGQILWMPCHRSHLDYLLLSFILFQKGFVPPHIFAGSNLNFWPIGGILRRGGAFFIRRSFAGNKIYSQVVSQYIHYLLEKSFTIEFFHEGGRTRIGKLMPPKVGFLNICVTSILKRKAWDSHFAPIFIGYEKVLEEATYAREMMGMRKKKENFWQFMRSYPKYFKDHGSVDVVFGEPLSFSQEWETYFHQHPWLDADDHEQKIPTINAFVKFLAKRANQRINRYAVATSTVLISTILLQKRSHLCLRTELERDLECLEDLFESLPKLLGWSIKYERTSDPIKRSIEHGLMKIVDQDVSYIQKTPSKDPTYLWYRGTLFHFLAVPSFILQLIQVKSSISLIQLESYISHLRNFLENELFWDDDSSSGNIVEATLSFLEDKNLIFRNDSLIELNKENIPKIQFYCQLTAPEREIYGIQLAVATLLMDNKGKFSKQEVTTISEEIHKLAFEQHKAFHDAWLSKVFAQTTFETYLAAGIYVSLLNQTYHVDYQEIQGLIDVFEVNQWRDFIGHSGKYLF